MDNVPIVSNGVPEEGMQIWKLFSCVFGYNLLVLGRVNSRYARDVSKSIYIESFCFRRKY